MNKIRRGLMLALVSLLLVTTGSGCAALYFIFGNGTNSAQYKLPKRQRVLVLVDSAVRSPLSLRGISDLEQSVSTELYQHHVCRNLVPAFRLVQLEKNARRYHQMGIADIASAVNAQVVVYVFVDHFSVLLQSDRQISRGYASAVVKVVSGGGKRLFPKTAMPGIPVSATIPAALAHRQTAATVERALVAQLADKIAKIFYSHSVGYHGG